MFEYIQKDNNNESIKFDVNMPMNYNYAGFGPWFAHFVKMISFLYKLKNMLWLDGVPMALKYSFVKCAKSLI